MRCTRREASSTASIARWRRTTSTSTSRVPGTPASSPSRRRSAPEPGSSALAQAAAVGPVEAWPLPDEVPEPGEAPLGKLEAPHDPARHQAPAALRAHEVPPDLHVALPGEVGRVPVHGEAGPSLQQRESRRLALDGDLPPRGVRAEWDTDRDRESIRAHPAERARVMPGQDLHALVPGRGPSGRHTVVLRRLLDMTGAHL